ncbi:MAG: hypothetical protein P8P74_01815 [Crocinitomicaceae bacterium]|nr:hypothetical protein [Crocinitomicaceae bacterium]
MKTERNKLTVKSNGNTALFRALFLFQIELENRTKELDHHDEVQELIASIDKLMELLLKADE